VPLSCPAAVSSDVIRIASPSLIRGLQRRWRGLCDH